MKGWDNLTKIVWLVKTCMLQKCYCYVLYRQSHSLQSYFTCNQALSVRVNQFNLFIDNLGLLRGQGRICNSTLSITSKKPILLSSNHPWVTLLIQQVHQKIKHTGTVDTLSMLRERYWILKGRQTVKKILRSCVICNKLEGVPYSSVIPPDLPSFRTSDEPPFSHTGIDYAGPLM